MTVAGDIGQGGAIGLRAPGEVMRLSRLGSFHATRLGFMRQLMRRIGREGWRFDRPLWEVDARGVGRAVYRARGPRTYCLVAFTHDLPDSLRSDRVIAEAWDATFALIDGEPTRADLDRLQGQVPLQEAGAHERARVRAQPRESLGPAVPARRGRTGRGTAAGRR